MELIWSNDGVSTLLLPAKILLFPEEKENKSTKKRKNAQRSSFGRFPQIWFSVLFGGKSVVGYIPFICLF